MNYSIVDFNRDFPDEETCLQTIFNYRYGELKICPKCNQETKFYPLKSVNRKAYSCLHCRHQLHPLAQTIFHKSDTPLQKWFFAMYLMGNGKNGTSALELSRHLKVTYKCAHRIAKKIRLLMAAGDFKLSGKIEMDETLIGGKKRGDFGGNTKGTKQTVIGAVERGGRIKAKHTQNRETHTIISMVNADIALGSHMITDDYPVYRKLKKLGHQHDSVNHSQKEYVAGLAHTNTIEGFWSQLKRSLHGTYHAVSPRYLQSYVDEFAFRYNLPGQPVFPVLLRRSSRPSL